MGASRNSQIAGYCTGPDEGDISSLIFLDVDGVLNDAHMTSETERLCLIHHVSATLMPCLVQEVGKMIFIPPSP
jgi:hypothetical protein